MVRHTLSAVLGATEVAVTEILLQNNQLVLAGGAALRACDPHCIHLPSSDIDLFLLDATPITWVDALAPGTFLRFVQALQSLGYVFATSSQNTVLNAIGPFGAPRIQLVASAETSLIDLLSNFDFRVLQCAFDGTQMWHTFGCAQDIITHTATPNITTGHARIKKIQLKGYKLSKELQTLLDHAEPIDENKLEQDYPCVLQGVSVKYMEVFLSKFGLAPCSTQSTEWCMQPRKHNTGYNGHTGILWNQHLTESSRRRFLDGLSVVPLSDMTWSLEAKECSDLFLKSDYELRLPLCCAPFFGTDTNSNMMKLQLNQRSEYDRWQSINAVIVERFHDAIVERMVQDGRCDSNVQQFQAASVKYNYTAI